MMFSLHKNFPKIQFSSLKGVAPTNFVTHTQTDGQREKPKTLCLPTKVGGDIIYMYIYVGFYVLQNVNQI